MVDAITTQYLAMQQGQTQQEASTAVLKSAIDGAVQNGDNVEQMIHSAGATSLGASDRQIQEGLAITDPSMGQHIDLTV
ncbi:MAG: putative motility protein [Alkalispirochaeta sp.]